VQHLERQPESTRRLADVARLHLGIEARRVYQRAEGGGARGNLAQ
jgi:hypothetical protein